MLKRYMHKRERYFAMLNDNRVVRPFEWGTEFIGHEADAPDPHEIFSRFSVETILNSDEYFSIPTSFDFAFSVAPSTARRTARSSPPYEGGVADASADGVVLPISRHDDPRISTQENHLVTRRTGAAASL